jgi:hypothetical protein
MTSLIGLSAQALADELRQRGIVSIKVDERAEYSGDGEITLSPTLTIGVTEGGCYLTQWLKPLAKHQHVTLAEAILDMDVLEKAIRRARWTVAKP